MTPLTNLMFTILINNYNYGRFLGKAIESALNQSWPNVEVLLVDDGSTDNSLEVASCYSAPNYQVLAKENGGQNSAIAFGLRHAAGEYVIVLDSDDWLKPQACETIAESIAETRPNAIFYRLECVNADGNVIGYFPVLPFVRGDQREQVLRHGTLNRSPTSGNAYRLDFLEEAFRYIQPSTFFCDGYLALAAAWTREINHVDDVLGCYLIHGGNVSQRSETDDAARRFKNINFTLDHFRHLFDWLQARGEAPKTWLELIDAYTWQQVLYFKLTKGSYGEVSFGQIRWYGLTKFLRARQYGWKKQIKNGLFLLLGSVAGELRQTLRRRG